MQIEKASTYCPFFKPFRNCLAETTSVTVANLARGLHTTCSFNEKTYLQFLQKCFLCFNGLSKFSRIGILHTGHVTSLKIDPLAKALSAAEMHIFNPPT